jgi:hypothetical protein
LDSLPVSDVQTFIHFLLWDLDFKFSTHIGQYWQESLLGYLEFKRWIFNGIDEYLINIVDVFKSWQIAKIMNSTN